MIAYTGVPAPVESVDYTAGCDVCGGLATWRGRHVSPGAADGVSFRSVFAAQVIGCGPCGIGAAGPVPLPARTDPPVEPLPSSQRGLSAFMQQMWNRRTA